MKESESNAPKFDLVPTPIPNGKTPIPISFFNYHPTELKMMVIYGANMRRSLRMPVYFKFISSKAIMAIGFLATVLLCLIRKKYGLRNGEFFNSWIDIVISFYGGARIRITHRIERWFFASTWMTFFFIHAIFGALMLDTILLNPTEITLSIDEIKSMNPPVFLSPTLEGNVQPIKVILRSVFFPFFIFSHFECSSRF